MKFCRPGFSYTGYFYSDNPGAGHDEFHDCPIACSVRFGRDYVVHRCHSGHGRHIIIDENAGVFYGLSPGVFYLNFDRIVADDGRVPVQPYLNVVFPDLVL